MNENTQQFMNSSRTSLNGLKVLVMTSGHEVTDHRVYAKQACSFFKLGAQVTIVGYLEHREPENVQILPVPKPSSRVSRFLVQPWRCLWKARKLNPDIIHFHDAEMLVTLPIAKLWWFRSKFVYDVHEDFANLMLIRDWLPSWLKPLVRVVTNSVEKGLAWWADAIVGVTPPLADKFNHRNTIVAYNYISQEFFDQAKKTSRSPQARDIDLIHLGTLNVRRAIFLAETICELHRLKPASRSMVIGVSPDIEMLMKQRTPDGCTVLGKKAYKEIPEFLGNAKVGLDVHPWLGAHLNVALPVKVGEYMACGCAVVSSAMPILNQILEKGNANRNSITIIDGGEPSDYAKAAVRLIEQIESGVDPGFDLRELATTHMNWDEEAERIAQLYLSLLSRSCVT